MRLQKYIANAGICSRRKAEELIIEGKVTVNNETITELGFKIDSEKDIVYVNGKKVEQVSEFKYVLLNKPVGYVTTVKEQFDRPTVIDLIKNVPEKLLPVGRLDMYTSGAIILTNDGDFIYKVTHPKHEVEKTYNATVRGIVDSSDIEKIEKGLQIDDYITAEAKAKILKTDEEKNISRVQITIHEGKNREVRKMCEAIGKKVIALHRAKIGNISVKDMKIGEWRYLSDKEVKSLL
ncbi:MAG: rRNA pseudouridine synthase [Clostridia bacterium]|nr:rRNA pseudouridine synthase [Clostridia bacterium]